MIETRDEIKVMYVEAEGGLAGVAEAFHALESRLPSLEGRKFYGAYHHPDGPYRACVGIRDDDDPASLGLALWTIPGGRYLKRKMENWQEHIGDIRKNFEEMAREQQPDPSRPSIEYYRSDSELLLFLPVV